MAHSVPPPSGFRRNDADLNALANRLESLSREAGYHSGRADALEREANELRQRVGELENAIIESLSYLDEDRAGSATSTLQRVVGIAWPDGDG
jgi:predicted nuclease with TOPRIM domain